MNIEKRFFGNVNGEAVDLYTMTADSGLSVSVMTFGASIQSLTVPDREGKLADIVGGFDDPATYVNDYGYHGATVGRVCNRIRCGRFTLDGKEYSLAVNNGANHLHGGPTGFSHRNWTAESFTVQDGAGVLVLSRISPDGEEGYPGTLKVQVTYTLTEDALAIKWNAETDKRTIVNLTNHAHFNLGGYDAGKVFDHELWLDVESYTEVDETMAPTGRNLSVVGTPFDFTAPKTIGRDFDLESSYLKATNGYDHSLNLVKRADPMAAPRARAYDPRSGRMMELYTDQPAIQLVTGNYLCPEYAPFKGGVAQSYYSLFCLEVQKMPDSINHEGFTDTTLDVGEQYEQNLILKFSVK